MIEFRLTDSQRFLCLCIRHCDYLNSQEIRSLYTEIGDEKLFKEASLNGVISIVAHALNQVFPSNIPKHWIAEYNKIDQRIRSYMIELDKVSSLLAKNGIPLLALKNSGITRGMYPYYGACPMGDIDVLVSKKVFRKAHKILTDEGYQLKFRCPFEEDSLEAAEHSGGAEYSLNLPNGEHLWFELQWRPVAGRWIQPDQEPDADDLIQRSIPIEGSDVKLLSPEDNLLQVALHTAKHTFVRSPGFRLHTDVDRIVSSQKIDWSVFVERVVQLKTKTAVFMSLAMAKSLLGTPIPDSVLNEISPAKWKVKLMAAWLQRVGIFVPDATKWSKLGYIVFVSLLYDHFSDLVAGVFPKSEIIKEQYHFKSNWLLPYYYYKRLANLVLRRVNT